MALNTLRGKISCYLLLLVTVAAAIGYEISASLLSANTQRLTQENQRNTLARAALFMESLQESQKISTHDYAEWKDTIDFIHGNGPDYLDNNFNQGAMENLNAHFILFIKADHTLYRGISRGGSGYLDIDKDHPIWSAALEPLTTFWSLPAASGKKLTGWYQETPFLMAVSAILDPNHQPPNIEGWVVMIRLLDEQALAQIRDMTRLDIQFFNDPGAAPATELFPLADGLNSNSIMVQVPLDTQLQEQQQLGNRILLINILLILLATGVGTIAIYERMVMRPLGIFSNLARQHSTPQQPGPRWPMSGDDEFDDLAISLNNMVDKLKQSELALYNEARRDGLTQLGNRKLLSELLERYSAIVDDHPRSQIALLLLDLDDFKILNDTLGHESGDRILTAVAERLKQVMNGPERLFRMGGDEFAIICLQFKEEDSAIFLASRLLHALSHLPVKEGEREVRISASIGIAYHHEDMEADELIRNADLAMYDAKLAGKHCYRSYSATLHQQFSHRMRLEQELREALQQQRLEVWYQPIVDISNGQVVMVEALCRWPTPNGFCPPGEFIPLAEQSGLIVPLGNWLTAEAIRTLHELRQHHPALDMNINLSILQLMEPDLIVQLCQQADSYHLPRGAIHLELTESLFAESRCDLAARLLALNEAGFKIHLDDFGTGYSSLERLLSLPISAIKLDHSFTGTLQTGDDRLVRAVLLLGNELGLPVIAEGVETEAIQAHLSRLGYSLMQGYLFAKPMNREVLTDWLDKHSNAAHLLIDGRPQLA